MALELYIARRGRNTHVASVSEFMDLWGDSPDSPRIRVPLPYHDEVKGMIIMMGFPLQKTFFYEDWYHGKACVDGWWIVLDPEKDAINPHPEFETLTLLGPRR